jgi:hypothetical protein
MKSHERYIERDDLNDATHLEVSVSYDIGGTNYFSGGTTPRGYYLTVKPVTKGNNMTRYTMFSGKSLLLLETKRFTPKQFANAVKMAKNYEDELINAVVSANKAA